MAEPITYTESFTLDGAQVFVRLANSLVFRPVSFKIDGAETPLKQEFVDEADGSSWFWIQGSPDIHIDSITPPTIGTVILVSYQLPDSNYVQVTAPDSITDMQGVNEPSGIIDPDPLPSDWDYIPPTPSGIYQGLVDMPGITSADGAAAVAAGNTNKTSVIPESVKFFTYFSGLRVGQNLPIDRPLYGINNKRYLVSDISRAAQEADMGHGTCFRHNVTVIILQDAPAQVPENPVGTTVGTSARYPIYPTTPQQSLAQRTAIQPNPSQWERAVIVLGTGSALVAGNPLGNQYPIRHTGTLYEITINSPTPPINQKLVVDVFQGGVSVLGPTKLEIASGVTDLLLTTRFFGYPTPYRMLKNNYLTFSAEYKTGTGARTAARDVTVTVEWYF